MERPAPRRWPLSVSAHPGLHEHVAYRQEAGIAVRHETAQFWPSLAGALSGLDHASLRGGIAALPNGIGTNSLGSNIGVSTRGRPFTGCIALDGLRELQRGHTPQDRAAHVGARNVDRRQCDPSPPDWTLVAPRCPEEADCCRLVHPASGRMHPIWRRRCTKLMRAGQVTRRLVDSNPPRSPAR